MFCLSSEDDKQNAYIIPRRNVAFIDGGYINFCYNKKTIMS